MNPVLEVLLILKSPIKVGPFSLLKNDLNITKDLCTINIVFKNGASLKKNG